MTRRGSGECGSYATTGNTTVARRLSTTQTPRVARPSTPDTALSGRAGLLRVRPCVRPGTSRGGDRVDLARRQRRHTIKETRRNDESGGRARPRGVAEISGSADGVARLVSHQVRLEHRSGLAAFDWAVARSVLR